MYIRKPAVSDIIDLVSSHKSFWRYIPIYIYIAARRMLLRGNSSG